ncbi:MAG: hypothetical protein EZS28_019241 [Streblomastix strix]|uniref:Uncharacterized protein n=1 Tax=Streblomastix strix TaxID=222440 RepID=A0A5J4VRQ5_9EUKA|nr:MAG: hypothetical protein EZS28_019241 [Streblomastix strix]
MVGEENGYELDFFFSVSISEIGINGELNEGIFYVLCYKSNGDKDEERDDFCISIIPCPDGTNAGADGDNRDDDKTGDYDPGV